MLLVGSSPQDPGSLGDRSHRYPLGRRALAERAATEQDDHEQFDRDPLESAVPDIRSCRAVSAKRVARQAWPLALVVLMSSVVISGGASPDGSPRAAARTVLAQGSAPLVSGAASLRGDDSAGAFAGAPAAAQAAAPALGVLPRAAVHLMSMDAPIQGGFSAHQEQTLSARLLSAHQIAASAPQAEYWTPAMGRSAVARAESWLGMPYSWAGGNAAGPTPGQCVPDGGSDLDCHVVGFDCQG